MTPRAICMNWVMKKSFRMRESVLKVWILMFAKIGRLLMFCTRAYGCRHWHHCCIVDTYSFSPDSFLSPYCTSSMTDPSVDSLPMLFLAYCTMTDPTSHSVPDDRSPTDMMTDDPTPCLSALWPLIRLCSSLWVYSTEEEDLVECTIQSLRVYKLGTNGSQALSLTLSSNHTFAPIHSGKLRTCESPLRSHIDCTLPDTLCGTFGQ